VQLVNGNKLNLLLVGYLRNWPAEPKKKEDRMAIKESDQLNELVGLMRDKWQDNAVEAFAGLLSTFVSEKQLQVLIDDLRQK
jgi:hypothetical protein